MRSVLRRLVARHAALLISTSLLLAVFQFLICAAVASANVGGAIELLLSTLPPIMQSAVTSQLLGGLTIPGLIAFGWSHPIAHALGTAVAIVLAARAIAGEAEAGTIELVLSQPLSRRRYFGAHVLFALAALAAQCVVGVAGTLVGQRAFGLQPFPAPALTRLAANYWALQAAWFGVTLLLSALAREGGRAATVGFMVALTSYLAQVIGVLWSKAAFVLRYTPHHYFSPHDILARGAGVARPVGVLLAVLVVATSLAWVRFRRRDLP